MRGRLVAAILSILVIPALTTAPLIAGSKKDAEDLDSANRRWRGARCRTRQMIEIKKGKDRDGSSKSKWIAWSPKGGNECARLWFSDGDAVRRMLGGTLVPIGTELVAKGWFVEKGTLYLALELASLPVSVKVYYRDDWVGLVSESRIEDFERWARFDLFELLSSPAEELVEVATAPDPVQPPSPTVRHQQTEASTGPTVLVVELRVLSASVEPARATAGQEVQLVVVYSVTGVPQGFAVEVLETRTIIKDGQHLTSVEARAQRQPGAHESRQSLRLPTTLDRGIYVLEASIEAAGANAKQTAIFEVR